MARSDADPAEVIEYPLETKIKQLDAQAGLPDDDALPPICKVWEWRIMQEPWWGHKPPWISAGIFKDHPRLGNGTYLRSTTCLWINREIGMARTRNTLYQLMGPERPE
jgi:hypothetical protein